jgi:hypothetical protein
MMMMMMMAVSGGDDDSLQIFVLIWGSLFGYNTFFNLPDIRKAKFQLVHRCRHTFQWLHGQKKTLAFGS